MQSYIIKPGLGKLDYIYSEFVLKTLPFWKSLYFTPNILTTLSLLTSILCIYFIYKRKPILALIFLFSRMYFDFADGLFARKYNQTSNIGDWYDHIVDVFSFSIPLIIVLCMSKHKFVYVPIILILFISQIIHIGCIEKEYTEKSGNKGDSLDVCAKLCFSQDFFKLIDNSTFYILVAILILVLCKNEPVN